MARIEPKAAFGKFASKAQEKVSDFGEQAVKAANEARKDASEAIEATAQKVKTSIYNPLFPEQFTSSDYSRPKMIVLASETERKDIDVCEGSIGWTGKSASVDVLHLYEEAVPFSNIIFFPQPQCDSVYYEDSQNKNRYISLECYFDTLQKDKLVELQRIARELGAKKCVLESYEEAKSVRIAKAGGRLKDKGGLLRKDEDSVDAKASAESERMSRVIFSQVYEGNAEPKRPALKWYAHDKGIEELIEARCAGDDANRMKEYNMQLDNMTSQTMNVQVAAKLDKALKSLGAACNFSLEGEALTESRRKLLFKIEF